MMTPYGGSIPLLQILPFICLTVLCLAAPASGDLWPFWRSGEATASTHSQRESDSLRSQSYVFADGDEDSALTLSVLRSLREHERQESARNLLAGLEKKSKLLPCWKQALSKLKQGCAQIQSHDASRSHFALALAMCDAQVDGRTVLSYSCSSSLFTETEVRQCLQGLSETSYVLFVQYRLHTDVLCAYLQEELFQERTEIAVASLRAEAIATVRAIQDLRDAGDELLRTARSGTHLQQKAAETAELVDQKLRGLAQQTAEQILMWKSLARATDDILHTSTTVNESLLAFAASLKEASTETKDLLLALDNQARYQYETMKVHGASLIRLMEQMDSLQRAAEASAVVQVVLRSLGVGLLLLLITSSPRTCSARLPCLLLWLVGVLLPLFLHRGVEGPVQAVLATLPVWYLCMAGCLTTVMRCAYIYVPASQQQRQFMREEMSLALREAGFVGEATERVRSNASPSASRHKLHMNDAGAIMGWQAISNSPNPSRVLCYDSLQSESTRSNGSTSAGRPSTIPSTFAPDEEVAAAAIHEVTLPGEAHFTVSETIATPVKRKRSRSSATSRRRAAKQPRTK